MSNLRFQSFIILSGVLIAIVKFGLYFYTKSNALFSDALESMVNIAANMITLYSLYLASRPKDKSHPYGHGKVEFLAAGIEGTLLFAAGLLTLHKSVSDYLDSTDIHLSGMPLIVVLILGAANYTLGQLSEWRGKRLNSPSLISGGKHLKGDGYTSFAILIGLAIMLLTGIYWIDMLAAVLAGLYIIYQGYTVVMASVRDILDTADEKILYKIVDFLQKHRDKHWIDIHNFRIIKYGSEFHVDTHLTLPFYYTNREVHREMKGVHDLINVHFNSTVEIFIHPDPCEPFCCKNCQHLDCLERKEAFQKEIAWTLENVLKNEKHRFVE